MTAPRGTMIMTRKTIGTTIKAKTKTKTIGTLTRTATKTRTPKSRQTMQSKVDGATEATTTTVAGTTTTTTAAGTHDHGTTAGITDAGTAAAAATTDGAKINLVDGTMINLVDGATTAVTRTAAKAGKDEVAAMVAAMVVRVDGPTEAATAAEAGTATTDVAGRADGTAGIAAADGTMDDGVTMDGTEITDVADITEVGERAEVAEVAEVTEAKDESPVADGTTITMDGTMTDMTMMAGGDTAGTTAGARAVDGIEKTTVVDGTKWFAISMRGSLFMCSACIFGRFP